MEEKRAKTWGAGWRRERMEVVWKWVDQARRIFTMSEVEAESSPLEICACIHEGGEEACAFFRFQVLFFWEEKREESWGERG